MKLPVGAFPPEYGHQPAKRLLLGLSQLLIRMAGKNVLVDTGLGEKWNPADVGLLDFQQPRGMLPGLERNGLGPDDIDVVILTHLHCDHSGGGTRRTDSGLAPTFTNAIYYLQRSELEYVQATDARVNRDCRVEDWTPLLDDERLCLLDGPKEILHGLTVHPAPGHTPGFQIVLAESDRHTMFFPSDMFATRRHVHQHVSRSHNWDVRRFAAQRRRWLRVAVREHWTCVFCHEIRDPLDKLAMQ